MRALILTVGSRGDVQPYVALGVALRAAGHTVTLATLPAFEGLAGARGLDFAPLRGELLELLQSPQGKAALAGKGGSLSLLRQVMPSLRRMLEDAWAVAPGHDLVIYHPKALGGHSIAEKLGAPGVLALPLPLYSPTAAFPSPLLPLADAGARLNRASHGLMVRLAAASTRGMVNRWRREQLGLAPLRDELTLHGRPVLRLYGYSPAVLPTPPDWDAYSVATGYWTLDREPEWRPPEALATFLSGGPPPVYVGFGSMPSVDAARTTGLVLEALRQSGRRGVLATGWGGLAARDVPPDVMVIDHAPHDWLFAHVAAVVHHGGAGTTGAGLRAGAPTLVCPFFGDQPFWGRRVAAIGAGPPPIPQRRLTAARLAEAIHALTTDRAIQRCAHDIGERIRAEDGAARAVELIEAYAHERE